MMYPISTSNDELDVEFKYQQPDVYHYYPSSLWQEMRNTKSMVWVIVGGRGSGKTWDIVWNLVEKARSEGNIKIIAGRLKADKLKWIRGEFLAVIRFLNCVDEFDMNNQRFLHKDTGCEIHFMAVLDEDEVRGLQGVKYFFVDEAKDISKAMVETIIPSVRMEGGEVFFAFNPEFESDYLYQEYVLEWDLKSQEEQTDYIKKMCGDDSNLKDYKLWNRMIQKNIVDMFEYEMILTDKLGKPIKLLSDTLRSQYYAAEAKAKQRNTDDAWANFRHIWLGDCNYTSSGLVYYNQIEEISTLPKDLLFAERAYVDYSDNERVGYFINGKQVHFDVGADWGETTSATAIIISFDLEEEIMTHDGGIFIERYCYVVGEVYLSGAECKEALYDTDEFGSKLKHKIFHSIKNHNNKICRFIHQNYIPIIGDYSPRDFNISLKGMGLNVRDCIKSHESVRSRDFVTDNIDRIKERYKAIRVLKNMCPNFLKDARSFRREPKEVINDKGQLDTVYEYVGTRHTLDGFRYSKQPKLYGKKTQEYISPKQIRQRSVNRSYSNNRLTSWQKSANNIAINSRTMYKK